MQKNCLNTVSLIKLTIWYITITQGIMHDSIPDIKLP